MEHIICFPWHENKIIIARWSHLLGVRICIDKLDPQIFFVTHTLNPNDEMWMKRLQTYHSAAADSIQSFHPEAIAKIETALSQHDVVVVGMFLNPFVIWVRLTLWKKEIAYHYQYRLSEQMETTAGNKNVGRLAHFSTGFIKNVDRRKCNDQKSPANGSFLELLSPNTLDRRIPTIRYGIADSE